MNAPDPTPAPHTGTGAAASPDAMSPPSRRAVLSALADGDAGALDDGCTLWRGDAASRATWHAYHLIGDVMRSDDLAARPRHDASFLAAVSARLAAEPTVLAPAPLAASAARRQLRRRATWLVPTAVAAGFMAVAAVLVVTRIAAPGAEGPVLAGGPVVGTGVKLASTAASAVQPLVIEGRLIRDPRLDSYLLAHRAALGGVPAAVPGGVLRSVDTQLPAPVPAPPRR